ncbi:hypothetical protein GR212_35615 [Rhizobium lusitanum]|uniref:Uncharacterized protein n=1 Tax=Rhizobium lusitanum TaxID=293958 RepID=A0A6L9UHM3_9HYPH|nr:hypothetical protein [Rhizobium lusitanum]NEI74869.1 hypothetical protein [Rhizobium lusitanum]
MTIVVGSKGNVGGRNKCDCFDALQHPGNVGFRVVEQIQHHRRIDRAKGDPLNQRRREASSVFTAGYVAVCEQFRTVNLSAGERRFTGFRRKQLPVRGRARIHKSLTLLS